MQNEPYRSVERDRVFVDVVARAADERQRRSEKAQRDAVVGAANARPRADRRSERLRSRRRERVLIRVAAVTLAAIGKLGDAKLAQDRRDAADVIAVRMRNDDRVERVDSVAQEKRHDDSLADRFGDGAVALRAALEPSAGIDQQRVAARRLDDDRVGLSDVEHGDAKTVIDGARRPQHERRRERDRSDGERRCASAPKQRRGNQRGVVSSDAPRRRRRHRYRRAGKRADRLDDGEHPCEQPRVDVRAGLRERRAPCQRSCAAPSAIVTATHGTTAKFASTA